VINPTGINLWGNADVLIPSAQPAFPRQDADYQKPFNFAHQDGCTLDANLSLMWSPSCPQIPGASCAAYATQARFGGYADWRMPTVKELESIIDFSHLNPAVDPTYFPGTQADIYWSGTTDASSNPFGYSTWYVDFSNGAVSRTPSSNSHYVRLVRGAPAKSAYRSNGDGTVTDTTTGLMWKKDIEMNDPAQPAEWQAGVNTFLWQAALQRAVTDRTGGHADWHLANIKELRSLVDESRSKPALDPVFTPTPFQATFWSSSPPEDVSGYQNYALTVNADYGNGMGMLRGGNSKRYARFVRDAGVVAPPVPVVPPPVITPPPVVVAPPVVVPPAGETKDAYRARITPLILAILNS
jgi:hypothetical protein